MASINYYQVDPYTIHSTTLDSTAANCTIVSTPIDTTTTIDGYTYAYLQSAGIRFFNPQSAEELWGPTIRRGKQLKARRKWLT